MPQSLSNAMDNPLIPPNTIAYGHMELTKVSFGVGTGQVACRWNALLIIGGKTRVSYVSPLKMMT